MEVNYVHSTERGEQIIAYCARVSSPHQGNPSYQRLLEYCMKNGHWSIFEMADLCVEIETSRAIAAQLLRHKSFSFQEFSQRYSEVADDYELYEPRRQDVTNRQNSIDNMTEDDHDWWAGIQEGTWRRTHRWYKAALDRGIAKECARMILPLNTTTRLYMKGSVRSWIHYLQLRTDPSTQKEHRDIAEEIREIFVQQFPTIGELLDET